MASGARKNPEFDAKCYRTIFHDEYDTDFVSMGSSYEIINDSRHVGRAIQTLITGTKIIKLVDRDSHTAEEVNSLKGNGVRILSRRNIENYLLDDEVLEKLCIENHKSDKIEDVLEIKKVAIQNSVDRGNQSDDIKSASGEIFSNVVKLLQLTRAGNSKPSFLSDTISPLITKEMRVYLELYNDIFTDS